jgi:ubiquinone/menaquinone biosynthesis C-methylase UbiE
MTTYTHGHADAVLRSHRWRTADNSAAYLLPHLRPGLSLLDVGCGPGSVTADLAVRVAPGRVVGVDNASAPLDEARAAAAAAGVEVEVRQGDAYHLDFADDTFDVVHAHQVLQHVLDPVAVLREMARVAKPGGLVAVRESDYAAMAWAPASPGLTRWQEVYRATARSNSAEPDAGRVLLGWAHAAGLRDVTPSASTWCFANQEDRAWWGGLWADRTAGTAYAQQASERGISTPGELSGLADAWRAWAAQDDGWFVVVHGEILCRV